MKRPCTTTFTGLVVLTILGTCAYSLLFAQPPKSVRIVPTSEEIPEAVQQWLQRGEYMIEPQPPKDRRRQPDLQDQLEIRLDNFETKTERMLVRSLQKRVTLDYPTDTPITQIIEDLREQTATNILIDENSLRDIGLDTSIETHIVCEKITMRSALRHLLRPHGLIFVLQDEVILITTPDKASEYIITRVYKLEDILIKCVDENGVPCYSQADNKPIIDLITNTVDPKSWQVVGGVGTCEIFMTPRGPLLVVSQSPDVHEKVLHLLAILATHGRPPEGQPRPVIEVKREEQERRELDMQNSMDNYSEQPGSGGGMP